MERNSIKQLLMSSNYFVLNKKLVKGLGIETAFFLSVLVEADDQLADENGWFYQTSKTIEEITGLSNYKQTMCIEDLIKLGILEQENRGIPMKRYFKISFEKIEELVFKKFENCDLKNLKNSLQKNKNNKEHNIKNKNKEHNKKEREEQADEKEKAPETENIGMYYQTLRMLLSGYSLNYEKIAKYGKPIERIKAVLKFAKENNKGEGWITEAIRDDYKLEVYKKPEKKIKDIGKQQHEVNTDNEKLYEMLGI